MKKILLLLSILISSTVFSQTQVCPDVVCINTQDQDYFVLTTPGSTYNWQLSGGGVIQSAEATDTDADGFAGAGALASTLISDRTTFFFLRRK